MARFKGQKRSTSETLEEKQAVSKFVSGRRASLLTHKQVLKDLIVMCTSWDTIIHDLPIIPRRNDRCWIFCSDLISEALGLRTELLKLRQDTTAVDLLENEIEILEAVVRFAHQQLVAVPSFDGILADGKLLAASNIRLWYRSRVRKHARTLKTAAIHFQAARGRVQKFRTDLAVDHGWELDGVAEKVLEEMRVRRRPSCVIRPARVRRDDVEKTRPWLLHRISTKWSSVSQSTLQAAHPPEVDL